MNTNLEQLKTTPDAAIEKVAKDIIRNLPEKFTTTTMSGQLVPNQQLIQVFWPNLIKKALEAESPAQSIERMNSLFQKKFQPSSENLNTINVDELADNLATLQELLTETTGEDRATLQSEIAQAEQILDNARALSRLKELKKLEDTARDALRDKKQKHQWAQLEADLKNITQEKSQLQSEARSTYKIDPDFELIKKDILEKRQQFQSQRPRKIIPVEPVARSTETFPANRGTKITKDIVPKDNDVLDVAHIAPEKITPEEQVTDSDFKDYDDYRNQKPSLVQEDLAQMATQPDSLANMLRDDYSIEKHPVKKIGLGGETYSIIDMDTDTVSLEKDTEEKTAYKISRKKFDAIQVQQTLGKPTLDTEGLRDILKRVDEENENESTTEIEVPTEKKEEVVASKETKTRAEDPVNEKKSTDTKLSEPIKKTVSDKKSAEAVIEKKTENKEITIATPTINYYSKDAVDIIEKEAREHPENKSALLRLGALYFMNK